MDGYPFVAAFRFDARFQSVTHSLERIRNLNARVTSIIAIIRPRSIRPSVSFVVLRSWNTRSFETIKHRSLVSSEHPPKRADVVAGDADATTRRRDDTNDPRDKSTKDVPCARKVFHRRASVRVSRNASRQVRSPPVGTARPKPRVEFYLYVQTVM